MMLFLPNNRLAVTVCCISSLLCLTNFAIGHEQTWSQFFANRQVSVAKAQQDLEKPDTAQPNATLNLELWDDTGARPLSGLVRITNLSSNKAVELAGAIHREQNWYSISHQSAFSVPKAKLRVEVFHGIESQRVSKALDLTNKPQATLKLKLPNIYDPREQGLISGNTHLHLKDISYASAVRYLEVVPRSDGLDVVFLSHLRRVPDERTYISNLIVENSFEGGELARLSQGSVLFGNGEEHRHNFESYEEGYGHAMFLDLKKLIRPVSIGSGIMGEGTDGVPLRHGIRKARREGATVIWCHNHWGMEDIPSWLEGLVHAQNIFDGSSRGSYENSYYQYLNVGRKVPFSAGTDWFIYDFSRVYVPIRGELTVKKWLRQLADGRSYITNGTFLELNAGDYQIGDTISLNSPESVSVHGKAIGRNDFGSLELVSNGQVVHAVNSREVDGHFEANLQFDLKITEPSWFALRLPRDGGKNEFDKELFAHTSPIYVELNGQRIFRQDVARHLIAEIEQNILKIRSLGIFDPGEEEAVLDVHRQAITTLQQLMSKK